MAGGINLIFPIPDLSGENPGFQGFLPLKDRATTSSLFLASFICEKRKEENLIGSEKGFLRISAEPDSANSVFTSLHVTW
jgi:hypothetical protein